MPEQPINRPPVPQPPDGAAVGGQGRETLPPPCSLVRRLAVILYDSLLLACVVFVAWLPVPLLADLVPGSVGRLLRSAYLLFICFAYFGWFWRHGGQTLGMRAWRVRLVYAHAPCPTAINWRTAWMRFVYSFLSWAALGMGFLWSLFHPAKAAWHDLLTGTALVVEPAAKRGDKRSGPPGPGR